MITTEFVTIQLSEVIMSLNIARKSGVPTLYISYILLSQKIIIQSINNHTNYIKAFWRTCFSNSCCEESFSGVGGSFAHRRLWLGDETEKSLRDLHRAADCWHVTCLLKEKSTGHGSVSWKRIPKGCNHWIREVGI